jgi:valyl-tRNA synthetase
VLVTGFDIIFFWVARMMMMGIHFQREIPFHTVYIHALVRDEKGAKMSKSKGNVIDPLDLVDAYGADALRFTLAAMAAQGRDIKLARQRVEGYRNFATKLWNAARFAEMNGCARTAGFDPAAAKLTLNRWAIGEFDRAVGEVTAALEAFRFNDAANAAYRFVWNVFCDWYLELAKPTLFLGKSIEDILSASSPKDVLEAQALINWRNEVMTSPQYWRSAKNELGEKLDDQGKFIFDNIIECAENSAIDQSLVEFIEIRATTAWVLDGIARLLHPFMPYITEELWAIKGEEGPKRDTILALAPWPASGALAAPDAEAEIGWLVDLITEIRSARTETNVPAGAQIPLVLVAASAQTKERVALWGDMLRRLARLSSVDFADAAPGQSVQMVVRGQVAALPLEGVVDLVAERARLVKEIARLDGEVAKVDAKLGNADFMARAPEEVVEEQRERREEADSRRAKLKDALDRLG